MTMANDYVERSRDTRSNMKKGEKQFKRPTKIMEAELYYRRTDGFPKNNFNSDNSYPDDLHSEIKQKQLALHHRPRIPRKNGKGERSSDLNSVFDPMKDRHMWTMWRTAVNGRIVDQVRRLEKARSEPPASHINGNASSSNSSHEMPISYGKALSGAPPLSRFIRLDDHSKHVAQSLVREGQGQLKTSQFIYYGLPRVMVKIDRETVHESIPVTPSRQDGNEEDIPQIRLSHF